jgi:hypothetical protein
VHGVAVLGVALTLLATACTGDEEDASAPTTRPATTGAEETATTTARPLPPSDFAAEAASFSVGLSWAHPPGDAETERYALYRDGSILSTMSGSENAFMDDSVVPGRQYVYEIEARSADAISDRISATAETPVPPLRAARLAGAFNVRTRTLSQSGYVSYQAPVFGWSFRPRCRAGACEVRWSDLHRKRIRDPRTARSPLPRLLHRPVYDPMRRHPGDLVGRDRVQGRGRPRNRAGMARDPHRRHARPERARAAGLHILGRESFASRPPGPVRPGAAAHRR